MTDHAFHAHPDLRDALEELATTVAKKNGTVLFRQGQKAKGVYLLRTGSAVLTVQASGEGMAVPRTVGPGSVLGLPGVLSNKPYSLTARATQPCELGFVKAERLIELVRQNPNLGLQVLQLLSEEVRAARGAIS